MQSSGASAYTFQLGHATAEREATLCLPDVWHHCLAFCADGLKADHVIQKVVVTNRYTLDQHIAAFKPTQVMLFRRNRTDNYLSLGLKSYADESGYMEDKFRIFDAELSRSRFPIIDYELMPFLLITKDQLDSMRTTNQILWDKSEGEFGKSWGFGGIRTS